MSNSNLKAFFTKAVDTVKKGLLFLLKQIFFALKWIIIQIRIALRWIIHWIGRAISWAVPKASEYYQKALDWYQNSPEMQDWHTAKKNFVEKTEHAFIRLFRLEHLDLENADLHNLRIGRPHKYSYVLLKIIVGFFVVLFLWASVADIDDITHAEGRVIPSAKMQIVQNQEGGIIQKINVHQGEKVEAGDVLVTLSPTQFGADFESRNQQRMGLMAKVARLESEMNDKPLEFPEELKVEGTQYITLETNEYQNRKARLKADLAVYENQYKNAKAELEIIGRLVERGLEPRLELIRTETRVVEARSKIDSIKKQFKSDISADLSKTNQELSPLLKALPALEDKLDRTTVRAPVKGVINRVLVTTTGGTIKAGEPIVEIVPSDDTLVVEARLLPKDIGFVKIGQNARVKLTAYDYAIFGSIDGTITQISADAVSTEERGQTSYYYIARVETNSSIVNSLGKKLPVIPGMQAQVDVITGHKTVLRYLLKPLIGVKENAFRER